MTVPVELINAEPGLPVCRHIPGSGSQPEKAFLFAQIQNLSHSAFEFANADHPLYQYGWYLFSRAFYWECHEVWEYQWTRLNPKSRERLLMQALIQIANSRLKAMQGDEKAGLKIIQRAETLMRDAYQGRRSIKVLGISQSVIQALIKHNNA